MSHASDPRQQGRGGSAPGSKPRAGSIHFLGAPHRRKRVAPAPGAPPGELAVPSHAAETRIHLIRYDEGSFEEREIGSLAAVPGPGDPSAVTWIDVQGFGDREALEGIRELFGIHPLALADVVHVPQRPKAEPYEGHLLIVTQMARLTREGEVEVDQLGLVLGPGWVVTFQERPEDVFDPVRARIRAETSRLRKMGADFLAYSLIDAVVDGYFPVIESIGAVLEELEEEVVARPRASTLTRIHAIRRILMHLHRIQWRQRDAIGSLLRDDGAFFSTPVHVYLRDAHDHAFQTVDAIETYRDMSVGLMDVYLSSTSQRLNEVMKTLTVMASIFIPLSFIASVYGMNFRDMPELHWSWGYPAVLALMLTTGLGLLAWFRRRGWVGVSPKGDDGGEGSSWEDRARRVTDRG